MHLNNLKPAKGSSRRKTRVGRGIGSGIGKTSGRGIKGAGARKSPNVRPGFEGGQMPLKIRLPKFGFHSPKKEVTAEVTLNDLNKVSADVVDHKALLDAGLITSKIKYVKIVLSRLPKLTKKVQVKGLGVTKGAKAAIEAAGGSVEVAEYSVAAAKRRETSAKRRASKQKALLDKLASTGIVKPTKKDKGGKAKKADKSASSASKGGAKSAK